MLRKLLDRTPSFFTKGTTVYFGKDNGNSLGIWRRGTVDSAPSDNDPSLTIIFEHQGKGGKKDVRATVPIFFDPCIMSETEFELYIRDARVRHAYMLDAIATFPEGSWKLYWSNIHWAEYGPHTPSFDPLWLLLPKKP